MVFNSRRILFFTKGKEATSAYPEGSGEIEHSTLPWVCPKVPIPCVTVPFLYDRMLTFDFCRRVLPGYIFHPTFRFSFPVRFFVQSVLWLQESSSFWSVPWYLIIADLSLLFSFFRLLGKLTNAWQPYDLYMYNHHCPHTMFNYQSYCVS